MFCPNCGAELDQPRKFCINCGAKLSEFITPEAPNVPVETPTEAPAAEIPVEAPAVEKPAAPVNVTPAPPVERPAPVPGTAPAPPVGRPAPVPGTAPAPPVEKAPAPASPPAPAHPKKKKTGLIAAIVAAVVVLAVLAVVLIPKLTAPKALPEFELKDYLTVTYDGLDGYGNAYLEMDQNALIRDICAVRKVDPKFLDEPGAEIPKKLKDAYTTVRLMEPYVCYRDNYIANPYYGEDGEGLKNGDQFTVSVIYAAEPPDKDLTVNDAVITVAGLQAIPKVDPFEGFSLEFDESAISGNNLVWTRYEGKQEGLDEWSFEVEPQYDVRNGDTVTVRLSSDADFYESLYGFTPSVTEKTFTVEGLPAYVQSFEEISETALDALKASTLEQMKKELEDVADTAKYTDPVYIGYAFLRPTEEGDEEDNALVLFYRCDFTYDDLWWAPEAYFYTEKYSWLLDTDDAAEKAWNSYNAAGIAHVGGAYLTGFTDPYEYVEQLKTSAKDDAQEISFGGEVTDYTEGNGRIETLADVSEKSLADLRAYSAARIVKKVEDYGGTATEAPQPVGEYLLQATNTDKPEMTILLLLYTLVYKDEDGVAHSTYVPYEFDGVRTVRNALIIDEDVGAMTSDSEGTVGFSDFSLLHAALLSSAERLGEASFSDSIAALAG